MLETLRSVDSDELTVGDTMVTDVYTVLADAPVDEVLEHMADHKVGSTVVVDQSGRVNGIFTTVDALQFFADVLRRVTA
jgi:predicted transcriptional regulator